MEKKYRRIYFWFIFLLTLILIPILLLYSSGYRFDFKNNKIIKTGSLYVETIPEDVLIYINDEVYPKKPPVLINNLLPNEYKITLKKDGYISWEKNLGIESTKTTFINKAILIKENKDKVQKINKSNFPDFPAKEIITTEIANIISKLNISSDLKIDKSNKNLLTILDKKNKKLYLIQEDSSSLKLEEFKNVTGFKWNEEKNNQLLFYNDLEIWTYDTSDQHKELITRQSEKITEAVWFHENYVVYSQTDKIKFIEIDSRNYRQCYEIIKAENAYNLALDKKQENLFWQTENNYWQLNLID